MLLNIFYIVLEFNIVRRKIKSYLKIRQREITLQISSRTQKIDVMLYMSIDPWYIDVTF